MMVLVFDLALYLGAVLLIVGLRNLSHPSTASKGNILAAIGMFIGIVVALFYPTETDNNNYLFIAGGIVAGSVIGLISARRVAMTAMPEMVSLFNGFGGFSAALISIVWLLNNDLSGELDDLVVVLTNLFLGFVAFMGSMMAYGKLSGKIRDSQVKIPFNSVVNLALLLVAIVLISWFALSGTITTLQFVVLVTLSLIYGVTFVAPIGGADMPVVISLLNSLTGVTAAIAGIMTGNMLMLLGGILVGSSGTILTLLMCKAMNRPLFNVILGNFSSSSVEGASVDGNIKEVSIPDLAVQLAYSKRVAIIPGYGMAVAQAQQVVKNLDVLLGKKDVEVKYAIHPVAGRMPGHMNVLLAESDVSYEKLMDFDEANEYLATTDLAIVVGANDVVNPSAKEDKGSKIYGMPILDLAATKTVVVLKRSMSPGYAGIQNPLFFKDNNWMLFGDARKSLESIVAELKEL